MLISIMTLEINHYKVYLKKKKQVVAIAEPKLGLTPTESVLDPYKLYKPW